MGAAFGSLSPTSLASSATTPALALVRVLVGTASTPAEGETVQMFGNLPPLSYTLADSSYTLADDGTRGDATASDHIYSGSFNFGLSGDLSSLSATGANELFFKFVATSSAPTPVQTVEVPFASGSDRIWTLSGHDDTLGSDGQLVFGAVYSLTHSFTLDFFVSAVPALDTTVALYGDQPELGDWSTTPFPSSGPIPGQTMTLAAGTASALNVTFTDHDFVSGGSSCTNSPDAGDPQGCPLNFKAVGLDGTTVDYEGAGANHSMNDDVLNHRVLRWTWGDSSSF
jgi:hypothetical protein